jgi:transporter family-2 protein
MESAFVVAVVVGISIAIQVLLVGRASQDVPPLVISTALQSSGLVAGLIWVASQRAWSAAIPIVGKWWWLPLGALGWGIVAALGYASARLGASTTLAIVVASQLVTGLVLDLTTDGIEISIRQPLGAGLLVVGALLISVR